MEKIIINLLVIIFLLSGNLALSETLEGNLQDQREEMIDTIVRHSLTLGNNDIEISKNLIDSLRNVPRHMFVPKKEIKHAYKDRPVPIGFGQTISQPFIVALMTELLNIEEDSSVLEIGTGSGYQAAILAEMELKYILLKLFQN